MPNGDVCLVLCGVVSAEFADCGYWGRFSCVNTVFGVGKWPRVVPVGCPVPGVTTGNEALEVRFWCALLTINSPIVASAGRPGSEGWLLVPHR